MNLRGIVVGLLVGALAAGVMLTGAVEPLELAALNALFDLRGPRAPAARIVIVSIDEDSFDELDLAWPFPRALHGALLDQIGEGRPLAVGIDLLFPEPSVHGPLDDEALGAAVARAGNVVLGAAPTVVAEAGYVKVDPNPPIPVIRRGAAGVGPISQITDRDARVRRTILRHSVEAFPDSFDVHLYRLARQAGLPAAPLPGDAQMIVNFRGGPGTFRWVPYHRVLGGEIDPETFAGAIVLVGATTPVLQDVYATPFADARTMPGVEIHANTIDTLLRGDAVSQIPQAASLLFAAGIAVGTAWLVSRLRALRGLLAVAGTAAAVALATVAAFVAWNVWFEAAGVVLTLLASYGAAVVDGYVREQREKRRLARFFSPSVVREVVRQRSDVLGSRRQVVTVLFSDIRSFTSISERIPPELVADMLRDYLGAMTEGVFQHGGTVDKYVGDCIMALYNAPFPDPDHAASAVLTALDLQKRCRAVSDLWRDRLDTDLRSGVGINTGEVVVGALGSPHRLEYTAVGDTVNLAARLEPLTRKYEDYSIIIGEKTHALTRGRFLARRLGTMEVKGKARPVTVYGVLPADARKHARAALEATAVLDPIRGGERLRLRTLDISAGGLGVVGLPPHWDLHLKLRVRLDAPWLPAPLVCEGTIARRDGEAAAIAFLQEAGPEVLATIGAYVANRPAPRPGA